MLAFISLYKELNEALCQWISYICVYMASCLCIDSMVTHIRRWFIPSGLIYSYRNALVTDNKLVIHWRRYVCVCVCVGFSRAKPMSHKNSRPQSNARHNSSDQYGERTPHSLNAFFIVATNKKFVYHSDIYQVCIVVLVSYLIEYIIPNYILIQLYF